MHHIASTLHYTFWKCGARSRYAKLPKHPLVQPKHLLGQPNHPLVLRFGLQLQRLFQQLQA